MDTRRKFVDFLPSQGQKPAWVDSAAISFEKTDDVDLDVLEAAVAMAREQMA